uniref:hypothetical protein n=1 Tax=Ferrovibrio sp. TaxID=1917215 RepID=UPI0035AF5726
MAEEYTSGFYIRIYSYQTGGRDKKDSMSVGHFSIELMRPDGTSENYGFYPSGNPILSKGQLTNDAIKKAGFTDRLTSNAIPITSTEAQKVDKVFQKIKNDPSLYFVAGNNCQELLDTVLKESGIKAKSEDFLSEKQWGQFNLAKFGMSRPQHQSYQERTAPNHSSRPGQVDKTPSEPLSEAEFRKIMADHEMGRVLGDPSFREKAGDNLLPIVKGRENFEAQKKQMNEQSEFLRQRENQDSLEQSREAAEAAGVDNQRHELQPMDFETREEYERYRAQLRGSETEQKQPAADAADDAGREAGPDQRSDAGDASQQQQFAAANADSAIDTGGIDTGGIDTGSIDTGSIDTGGGNNGRNYAAELAALPLGREVSLNWLLEKSPDQWTQPELDDAQASDAYWNSRNPRHADVQNAVSDVYRYLYGNGSQSFRPDGSLPRAEPINALRGNTFRGNIQADADYL